MTVAETQIRDALNLGCTVFHQRAKDAGWWDEEREVGTLLALIHSEISEGLEAARKGLRDDHLPHRPGLEVELADALIRIFDLAGRYGYDLGGAVIEKSRYNMTRPDHRKEGRQKAF